MIMKRNIPKNPFSERLDAFVAKLRRRGISVALVLGETNQKGLVGFGCDNGILCVGPVPMSEGPVPTAGRVEFYTDFRYVPAAKRAAPWLKVLDMGRLDVIRFSPAKGPFKVGFEGSVPTSRYLEFKKAFGNRAKFVDIEKDILLLRAIKTASEIAKIAEAEALNDYIWGQALKEFRPGMTEKEMQRIIRAWMNALGDGEAFETIVCVGANAAECHHVPDDTVWRKGEPLLVDMGVKLDGYCSDMTRCVRSSEPGVRGAKYNDVYDLVLLANRTAIAAVKPGITGRQLDAVARKVISKAGFGKCFGHALGHGVGLDIHEHPVASKKSDTVLKPGMLVTIEPGVYIEGELGVRIEDLVLVTKDGCEVLSSSVK
jgi:Xaa-Pro aminopeptidase